jgi:hypothetical protein
MFNLGLDEISILNSPFKLAERSSRLSKLFILAIDENPESNSE